MDAPRCLRGENGKNPWVAVAIRAVSSLGRAPALHAGGNRFDPDTVHQKRLRLACRGKTVKDIVALHP